MRAIENLRGFCETSRNDPMDADANKNRIRALSTTYLSGEHTSK